jgi:dTDP-4-dehydrorhamnose reductase
LRRRLPRPVGTVNGDAYLRNFFVKILLFGSNGQVGWALQRASSPFGDLVATDRKSANFENFSLLSTAVEANGPNIAINAAAYTAVNRAESEIERAHLVDTVAVGRLARVASKQKSLLIHCSTDHVFDGLETTAVSEGDPTSAISILWKTKFEGDEPIPASGCEHLRTITINTDALNALARLVAKTSYGRYLLQPNTETVL